MQANFSVFILAHDNPCFIALHSYLGHVRFFKIVHGLIFMFIPTYVFSLFQYVADLNQQFILIFDMITRLIQKLFYVGVV